MVNIKGLDKARVLKALYDNSHVQGLGFMHAAEEGTVTVERCAERSCWRSPPALTICTGGC